MRVVKMKPSAVSSAPVKQHQIAPADLNYLPIAQSWPDDGRRFITFPLVITKSPVDGKPKMGVYRMHVYGPQQTGMQWQIAKGGGYHYQQAEARGEKLPLGSIIGA